MIQCPNCSGNLKFDIVSQKLLCDYCQTMMNPEDVEENTAEIQRSTYATTEFTCPQCGGAILGTDTSAAEFCIYCGSSIILSCQMKEEKRPDYIIPFKKTKEDCQKSYKRLMNRALFAPSELKNPENLKRFCGIYMPYWSYHVVQKGRVVLKGKTVKRRGNYEITDHFDLSCDINGDYNGISHDASSVFDDTITECLAPYNVEDRIVFRPSYVSGFYADISDVRSSTYAQSAVEIAGDSSFDTFKRYKTFRKYSISKPGKTALSKALNTKNMQPDSSMFPVWFMTYRKGDRLLYATVNGQTGKVVADIPIDYKKYIIGALILAVPVFFLLNLLFTFRPSVTIVLATIILLISNLSFIKSIKKIKKKEEHEEDRGYLQGRSKKLVQEAARLKEAEEAIDAETVETDETQDINDAPQQVIMEEQELAGVQGNFVVQENNKDSNNTLAKKNKYASKIPAAVWVIGIGIIIIAMVYVFFFNQEAIVLGMTASVTAIFLFQLFGNWENKKSSLSLLLSLISGTYTSLLLLINPAADWWFYTGAILSLISVIYGNLAIVNKYNLLSSRSIPSLHDRGGLQNE